MLRDMIKRHEGYRNKPYRCSGGNRTIGWGHNMDDEALPSRIQKYLDVNGEITRDMAEELLTKDIQDATENCIELYPMFSQFSANRQAALIDFLFNVGMKTAMTFKTTNLAINEGRWDDAANRLLKSKYAGQVGDRAREVASLLRDDGGSDVLMITPLQAEKIGEANGRAIWRLLSPFACCGIIVPKGFVTDFASVPRLPLAYWLCGDEAHEAATVHDYLYCADSYPNVDRKRADDTFLAIMAQTGVAWWRRQIMYRMVRMFAGGCYHKRNVMEPPK